MKIHEFDPVIYPYKVWVIVEKLPTHIADYFDEYSGAPILFEPGDVDRHEAFTMPATHKNQKRFGVILYFRNTRSMTFELVAHEATHAAKYLFEHIGADAKQHEPLEYVVGWIAGCCEKVKKGK